MKKIHNPDFIFPNPNTVFYDVLHSEAKEQIVDGPTETTKSAHLTMKLHSFACHNPGMKIAVVRKLFADLEDSFCDTFENVVLSEDATNKKSFVWRWGGTTARRYYYGNGSEIVLIGLDRNPNKVLGSAFDIIYVMQVEEVQIDIYEKLVGRATGRSGNLRDENGQPYGMVFCCCNPDADSHWLQKRKKELEGKTLSEIGDLSESDRIAFEWYQTKHTDNPMIFWDGEYTDYGKDAISQLETYTGLRRLRLYLGLWVGAEGLVYDIPRKNYLVPRGELPDLSNWTKYRAIDYGWHRFICLWIAHNEETNEAIVYREYRKAERRVEQHATRILELSEGEGIKDTVDDHDAEDSDTLRVNGITTRNADKRLRPGIDLCHQQLTHGKMKVYEGLTDGIPPCPIMGNDPGVCMSLLEELQVYRYKPEHLRRGMNAKADDEPYKEGKEDACDAMRYGAMRIWNNNGFLTPFAIPVSELKPGEKPFTITKF